MEKKKIIYLMISLAVVLAVSGCSLVKFLNYKVTQNNVLNFNTNSASTETLRRKIDGVAVDLQNQDKANLYPVAVMMENSSDAWPLSGLDKANLVIEAPVESSITRFVAIYANDDNLEKIGPVRSARPYYLDWILPYAPLYMHVGGSPDALQLLKTYALTNFDQFYNGQYFWRDSWRYAPHNVFTSSELIKNALTDKGLTQAADFQTWKYKDDLELEKRPDQVSDLVINFTTGSYQAKWQYNKADNNYLRYQAGAVMTMADNAKIYAKNVIVEIHSMAVLDEEGRKKITTIGQGDALIFRDGQMIEGVWQKTAAASATRYLDSQGNEIELNGGTTWIEIVPNKDILRY